MGINNCHQVCRLGRDVGMIPDLRMDRSLTGYLSPDSSTHLSSHYMDMCRSLSPEQLGVFNHSLRATLGESGKVTQGGMGVVALALSFLFDVLAQQAKNQTESTHFIHRIFREHEGDNSSEIGAVVSDYLRLVPLIANDPQRMKEETERYEKKLCDSLYGHFERTASAQNSSWTDWKLLMHGMMFQQHMMIHQVRMEVDTPLDQLIEKKWNEHKKKILETGKESLLVIIEFGERLRGISLEKQQILKRRKDKGTFLLDELEYKVLISAVPFFLEIEKNGPRLISQKEDFFY